MAKIFFSLGDYSAENIVFHLLPYLEDFEIYSTWGVKLEEKTKKVGNIADINATGILEVLPKFPKILKTKRKVETFLKEAKPDIFVAVDAPGFNLPLIKKAKGYGVKKVVYLVIPQIWAWKEGRKYLLERYCDLLIPVLPFELEYLKDLNVEIFYAGHPSAEILKNSKYEKPLRENYFVIFPGSRENELKKHIKVLKEASKIAVREFKLKAVLLTYRRFERYLKNFEGLTVYLDENPEKGYGYIRYAAFGWIKSGTTAFETAILKTPHLTFYKLIPLTYWLAKKLVKVSHIHLANLILKREAVPELVQGDFNISNLLKRTEKVLCEKEKQIEAFEELEKALKAKGVLKRIGEKLKSLL